mmetsp:Transcript_47475/g.122655  ORF Transcript_47475/g.122655 Transcript_47475/m.122655 type:complete len:282 (-) Transcript_47475:217-1062(-)
MVRARAHSGSRRSRGITVAARRSHPGLCGLALAHIPSMSRKQHAPHHGNDYQRERHDGHAERGLLETPNRDPVPVVRVVPAGVVKVLRVAKLGADAIEGPCDNKAHDGIRTLRCGCEDGGCHADGCVGCDSQAQECLRRGLGCVCLHAGIHSSRRKDPAKVQREWSAQQRVLGPRQLKPIGGDGDAKQADQNAAHEHKRQWDDLLGEGQRPADLAHACRAPPRRDGSHHCGAAVAREHLRHGEDELPDEDGPPDAEREPCGGHQGLVLLAQVRVGLAEDAR